MSEETHYIECLEHGRQQTTYVCQHVVQRLGDHKPCGFLCETSSAENPRPDAWCDDCEAVVNQVGEWNDESEAFAGIKILCGACYDRVKAMNSD